MLDLLEISSADFLANDSVTTLTEKQEACQPIKFSDVSLLVARSSSHGTVLDSPVPTRPEAAHIDVGNPGGSATLDWRLSDNAV